MSRLVSILIPAYNAEKWIAQTIASAVAQSWHSKEIIVVDDGSTDQTFNIAGQFVGEGVQVVRQENQGAAAARNKAYSLCSGDYIQWLDADDLLAPDKIARQMNAAAECDPRMLLSSSWGQFMYCQQRAHFVSTALWNDLSPADFLLRKLGQRIFMQTAVWLVSRKVTEAAGPWDTSMHCDDDGEYFCRVLLASSGIRFVPEAKVFYRSVGTASLSWVGKSNKKIEALWQSMQLHIRYLRSLKDSDRTRAACVSYLQNYLMDFYPLRPDIVGEMQQVAKSLGGQLQEPSFPWKYSWIKALFGRNCAQRVRRFLPKIKWAVLRLWDGTLFRIRCTAQGPVGRDWGCT